MSEILETTTLNTYIPDTSMEKYHIDAMNLFGFDYEFVADHGYYFYARQSPLFRLDSEDISSFDKNTPPEFIKLMEGQGSCWQAVIMDIIKRSEEINYAYSQTGYWSHDYAANGFGGSYCFITGTSFEEIHASDLLLKSLEANGLTRSDLEIN